MHPARERFGADGKARATRIPAAVCKERATPPDAPKRSRPLGLLRFLAWPALLVGYRPLRVCSLLAPWPRQKSEQRGVHGYFNRLLGGFRFSPRSGGLRHSVFPCFPAGSVSGKM